MITGEQFIINITILALPIRMSIILLAICVLYFLYRKISDNFQESRRKKKLQIERLRFKSHLSQFVAIPLNLSAVQIIATNMKNNNTAEIRGGTMMHTAKIFEKRRELPRGKIEEHCYVRINVNRETYISIELPIDKTTLEFSLSIHDDLSIYVPNSSGDNNLYLDLSSLSKLKKINFGFIPLTRVVPK